MTEEDRRRRLASSGGARSVGESGASRACLAYRVRTNRERESERQSVSGRESVREKKRGGERNTQERVSERAREREREREREGHTHLPLLPGAYRSGSKCPEMWFPLPVKTKVFLF